MIPGFGSAGVVKVDVGAAKVRVAHGEEGVDPNVVFVGRGIHGALQAGEPPVGDTLDLARLSSRLLRRSRLTKERGCLWSRR
jgi:hypothetical protein